ncbi:MAG: hemolysin family protein [Acidimicrobiales bacterium]
MSGLEILALVAAITASVFAAFLAVAETSLTQTSRARAAALVDEERPRAETLARLVRRRERVLNPVLFLLLTCHLGAATIVGALAQQRWGTAGVVGAFVVELLVLFVLAEAVPKRWALQDPSRAALRVAPLVDALTRVAPLRWITTALIAVANVILPGRERRGPATTEEELLAFAQVAAEADVIEIEERVLIESVIDFGDTVVREVMVPRTDMITVSADATVAQVIEVSIQHGFSRIPVSGEGIDDIVGVLHIKDLMRAEHAEGGDENVGSYLRSPHYVPETKKVSELLPEMQSEQFHIAIVIDEYGGTAGLVTLEDLIEELIGEIVDEFDREEPLLEPLPNGEVRVDARLPVDELEEILRIEFPAGDWDTVGGLLFDQLGHVPVEGEHVDLSGHRLAAERVQGRRIQRVRVTRVPA